MFDLTGFQRDLLYCIAGEEEPYGLGIKRALESYRSIEVNTGRLYTNLNTLVEKGYVAKGSIDSRTNSYELTAEGQKLLVERQEWEADRLPETRTT
jgi:DNA-binding PadR family transcriptional regulator